MKENDLSISKITHEIKNPLSVIKGYLQMFNPDNCEKYKDILIKEVDNALLVLKDINNHRIVKEHINFNELLCEVKETTIPFINIKRINLKIDSEKDIFIYADYNKLKQVLVNILKNSCEALNYNGTINISSFKSTNSLIINIKDNGKGMTKKVLNNLFTPFYTNKKNGTGIGLTLSKEIIDSHNGFIKYSSIPNKYTLVKIILPINNT